MEQRITWKSPKKLLFLLVSLLLLAGFLPLANLADPEVHFLDPNLEQAVRDKIEKPTGTIYRTHVLKITELDASGRGIERLDGIQALRRLTVLNLEDNSVKDLTPLARLGMLSELNLRNNRITDLDAVYFDRINHLPLRSLSLRHNVDENRKRLSNVTLLGDLKHLEYLDLRDNHVEDIAPLASLINLQRLNLRENHVKDIRSVQFMTGLVYLNIHSNPIESGLYALGNLHNLQTLIMRNVEIGDNYEFLVSLTKLQRLNIRNSAITDVNVIAELMQFGALQDDRNKGFTAYIDLLEISPADNGVDPYLGLRRYWNNISYRYPLSLPYYPSAVKPAVFSHESGFYTEGFYLTISTDEPGGKIYYTLDGSEPALTPGLEPMGSTQAYTGPLLVQSRVGEPNLLANIPTSNWKEYIPSNSVFKASIVRAIVMDLQGAQSNLGTQTYFVDEHINLRYTFPIVSIVTDSDYFFDDEIGIYVPGNLYEEITESFRNPANYTQQGRKWERPVFFQMFDTSGEVLIGQNIGIRIHGGASRALNVKSLRIYARTLYDEYGLLHYNFFPALNDRLRDGKIESQETLIIRNGGQGATNIIFRDVLAQSLLLHTKMDVQGYKPVIVFFNGEYWGIHNIRTRYDEHYFQSYYGINSDELLVLEGRNAGLRFGVIDDIDNHYLSIFSIIDKDHVKNNYETVSTLSDDKIYQQVINHVDIDNFIIYYISHIYFNNIDFLNNTYLWKKKLRAEDSVHSASYGHDGRWRWMILDVDWGFRSQEEDRLKNFKTDNTIATYLFRSLLQNDEFRRSFINQFADHLNTTFREQVVIDKINENETLYSPDTQEHLYRWGALGGSYNSWLKNIEKIREFARLRPTYQREHIRDYFDLPGTAVVNLQSASSQGYIRINTVDIREDAVGVDDPANWSGVYFQGVPVEISAISKEGYRFVRWESDNAIISDLYLPTLSISLDGDLQLTAVFESDVNE
jgi:Leucine-rich repeat (LRR) protein